MAIQTIRVKIDKETTTLKLKEKFVGKEVMITITDVLPKEKKKAEPKPILFSKVDKYVAVDFRRKQHESVLDEEPIKKKYTKDGKLIRPIKRKTSSIENLLITDHKIIEETDLILKNIQPFPKDIDIFGLSNENDNP